LLSVEDSLGSAALLESEALSSLGSEAFLILCLRSFGFFTRSPIPLNKLPNPPPLQPWLPLPNKSNAYTEPNVKTDGIVTKANAVRTIIEDIVVFLDIMFPILDS